jgi:type I restriction enzyme S subunit
MHDLRPLSDFAEVNPSTDVNGFGPETSVVFLPMTAIAEGGGWSSMESRPIKLRHSGYTLFQDGDVLVAKITPCFENGKVAFLDGLTPRIGIGSTEYHVLRARRGVDPRFVYHWVRHPRFRREGEASMTGSAGQRRVPSQFFDRFLVPDMNSAEQTAVANALDHVDERIEALVRETEKLQLIRLGLQDDLLQRKIRVISNSRAAE